MFDLIQKPRLFISLQQFKLVRMERKLLISLSNTVEEVEAKDLIEGEIVKMGLKVHDKGQQNQSVWTWIVGYQSQADKDSIQIFIKKLQDKYNSNLSIQQLNQQTQTKVSQKGNISSEKVKKNEKDVNQQDMNKKREQKDDDEGNDSFEQLSESSDGFQELGNGESVGQGKSQGFEGDEEDVKGQVSDKSVGEQIRQRQEVVGIVQLCQQSAQQSVAQDIQPLHALENQSIEKQAQNVGNDKQQQKRTTTKEQQSRQIEQQQQRQTQIQAQKVQIEDNEDIDNIDDTTEVLIKYYECKLKQRHQQYKQKKQEEQSDKSNKEQQQLISSQSLKYIKDLQQQVVALKDQQKDEQIVAVGKNGDQQQKQNRAQQQKQKGQQEPLGQRVQQSRQIDTDHNKGQGMIDRRQQYDLINSREEENDQEVIKNMNGQESIEFKIKFQYGDIQHQHKNQHKNKTRQDQKQQRQPLHHQQQRTESHDIKQQQPSHLNDNQQRIPFDLNDNQQQIPQSVQIQQQSPPDQHIIIQHTIQLIPSAQQQQYSQLLTLEQQYSQLLILDESCHQLLSKPIKQTPINTNLSHQLRHQQQQPSQDSLQLSQNSLTYINYPQSQQENPIQQQTKPNIYHLSQQQHSITSTIIQKRQPIVNKALLQMKNMQPSIQITKKQPLKQVNHKQPSIQMMQDKQQSDRLYPTTVQNQTSDGSQDTKYTLKRSKLKYQDKRSCLSASQSSSSSSFSLSYYNNQRYVILCMLAGVLVLMCYLFYL